MIDASTFNQLVIAWIGLGLLTFIVLFFVIAPYGRHTRPGWGPTIGNRTGWLLMEAPAALVFAAMFLNGPRPYTTTSIVFLVLWQAHYVHRSLIFPFTLRGEGKQMPLLTAALAIVFNSVNAYANGYYLFTLSGGYARDWLSDPRFLIGLAIFVLGFAINRYSDYILKRLRQPGETDYKIPEGGLYRWISCPNYLGEIVQWTGWAIATWSLPGLAFAVWTAANLIPRARSNHRWYLDRFADYPRSRKALFPGVW